MIFKDRNTTKIPSALSSDRATHAKRKVLELLSSASSEHLAQLRVTFDNSVWRQAVRSLEELFNGKCAYCESQISAVGGANIDHYRPKQGGARLEADSGHLFYSWLAYEWENLLIACNDCNRRRSIDDVVVGKGDDFPVAGLRAEFLANIARCRYTEQPLLLDPCFDQPSEHLACESTGELVGLTQRGKATIELLGLNRRRELVSQRRGAWLDVDHALKFAVEHDKGKVSDLAWTNLQDLLSDSRPYLLARRHAVLAGAKNLSADLAAKLRSIVRFDLYAPAPSADDPALVATYKELVSKAVVRPGKYRGRSMLPPCALQKARRIGIRNFKGIEELDLEIPHDPDPENRISGALSLLGENATGKSSVLEAVALAILGTDQITLMQIDGTRYLRRNRDSADAPTGQQAAEIRIEFGDGGYVASVGIDSNGNFFGSKERASVLVGYGPRRHFSHKSKRRLSEPWRRVESMFNPLATLPDPSRWLLSCSDSQFSLAVRALRAIMLLPDEAVVQRLAKSKESPPEIYFELEGRHESIETLSEGYKAVVAMSVDIMRELLAYYPDLESAGGIVLIDELDVHLHPRWKMRIAQRLRHAFPGVQFLTSTHDPLCLRGYYDREVQVLRRNSDAKIECVADLPNVQGLSVQQLLTSEFFGLYSAEDPALEESLARYSTLVGKLDRTPEEDAELEHQRVSTDQKISLGLGLAQEVVQAAIRQYISERRNAPEKVVVELKREAVNAALKAFKGLDDDPMITSRESKGAVE